MGLSRTKYRRVPDLYVHGTELVLDEDTVMWVQVLNSYEMEEARHDAQTAQARIAMALREEGSDELAKAEARFFINGREAAVEALVDAYAGETLVKVNQELQSDPEWEERLDIARRGEDLAQPMEDAERALIDKINRDYLAEVSARLEQEREYLQKRFADMTIDELREQWMERYLDSRGSDAAMAEYAITEVWYAARVCDGFRNDDGTWSHASCEGHRMRVWETKAEVRELPTELMQLISDAVTELNMSPREAKNSDRPGSSSASSPQPNAEAVSSASTQEESPATAPGTSPSPSVTP